MKNSDNKKPIETQTTPGAWYAVEYSGFYNIQDMPYYGGKNLLDLDQCPLAKQNAFLAASSPWLMEVLKKIANWNMPETGQKWPDGDKMSYRAFYGVDGERDYIIQLAQSTIEKVEKGNENG